MSTKKITRISSLILAVTLIASIMIPAVPAVAAYGQHQFLAQPLPTNASNVMVNGSDVTDIAVAPGIIYAIDGQTATGNVYKSTDGGQSFTKTVAPAATTLTKIAVAGDNANVIATTNGTLVWTSNDAGTTWTVLPAPAAGSIRDVAVAPARSGTLLGREYVIALADTAGTTTTNGDVQIIGGTAAWASVGGGIAGTRDYVAVAVTPNFVGDRSVVAVGSAGAGTLAVQVILTTGAGTLLSTALLNAAGATTDFGTANTGLFSGSISMPTDFDATTSSGRRAYVGVASATAQADNDVYRVDDTAARALGAVTTQGVYSVAYAGTISAGTLFMARRNTPEVKYSTDMTGNSPTWTTTKKIQPLSGVTALANNVVVAAPDFATSKIVYLGNTGTESAFSVSRDGGISFDGESLIDTGVANSVSRITTGPAISGTTNFIVTHTAGTGGGDFPNGVINVWKSSVPSSDTSWSRVFAAGSFTANSTGSMAMMPDYATTSTLLLFDVGAGATAFRTTDGGATWNNRLVPTGSFVYATSAWQDSNVGYVTDAAGNIFKTTNGAFTYTGPNTPNVGTIGSMSIGKTDELIVGGTGKIALSKDGGTTFTTWDGETTTERYRIVKDSAYATNNLIWLNDTGANTGTGNVYKMVLGTDAKPVSLLAPNAAGSGTIGLSLRGGVLYTFYPTRIDRTLGPTGTPGTIAWRTIPTTALAAAQGAGTTVSDAGKTIIYMRRSTTGSPEIWAYEDQMATAVAKITAPAAKSTLDVDPVTGRGSVFTLNLDPMGSGNGLANRYDVSVTEKEVGWAAATTTTLIAVSNPVTPQIASASFAPGAGFLPNKTYLVRARASQEISGDVAISNWSEPIELSVATGGLVTQTQFGPVLLGPQGGATNVSLTPGFSWTPQFGATKYQFKLATDAALTKTVGGTPATVTAPSFQVTTALINDTTYFWSVQVVEPAMGPVSIGTFTTAPKPAPPAPVPTITMPPITIPAPVISIPPQPTPTITIPPAPVQPQPVTPALIWAVIIIGAVLVIAVIVLIIRTRRVP